MSSISNPKIQERKPLLVLKALLMGIPVKLGRNTYELDEDSGLIGVHIDVTGRMAVFPSDGPMPLNSFIRKARELTDEDAMVLAASVALTSENRSLRIK